MPQDYAAAGDSCDAEKRASFLAKDCVVENMGEVDLHRGIAEIKAWTTVVFAALPQLKLETESLVVAGDWAGAEWIGTSMHTAARGPNLPTGENFSVRSASIIDLQEEMWL